MQVGTFNYGLAAWNRNLATMTTPFCISLIKSTNFSQPKLVRHKGFLLLESLGLDMPVQVFEKAEAGYDRASASEASAIRRVSPGPARERQGSVQSAEAAEPRA